MAVSKHAVIIYLFQTVKVIVFKGLHINIGICFSNIGSPIPCNKIYLRVLAAAPNDAKTASIQKTGQKLRP